jgi:hypothetical protein
VIEADINVDFDAPLDYVESAPVHKQVNSGLEAQKSKEEDMK